MEPEGKFTPPYNIPWTTFLSAVEKLAVDPPTRVDRSYLGSQSGNVQTYLIAALKGFGLIDKDARPDGARVKPFADPANRKGAMAELIQEHYRPLVELGQTKTTPDELREKFSEMFPTITGESKVKAIRFFLSGMNYADLPVSDLWGSVKAPRGASGGTGRRKAASRKPAANSDTGPRDESVTDGAALTDEAMRAMYFKLLLKKAENDDEMLDRIERLVGVEPSGKKPSRARKAASKPAAAPATPQAAEADAGGGS